MSARAAALLASLAVALAACILVVPDKDMSLACQFSGSGTACGQCIARHCQDVVNACCGDTSCESDDMPNVDSCASRGDCASLLSSVGRAGAIAQCVSASCADPCGRAADGAVVTSTTCWQVKDEVCSCSQTSPFADAGPDAADAGITPTTSCAPSSFDLATGACCNFPEAGTCVCAAMRCLDSRSTTGTPECSCGRYALDPANYLETDLCDTIGGTAHCCNAGATCTCADGACDDAGAEVTECTQEAVAAAIPCADGGVRVDRCK